MIQAPSRSKMAGNDTAMISSMSRAATRARRNRRIAEWSETSPRPKQPSRPHALGFGTWSLKRSRRRWLSERYSTKRNGPVPMKAI